MHQKRKKAVDSCIKLLIRTQKLGLKNSQIFPVLLTKELSLSLNLKACSFYTISGNGKNLILRGQYGFRYEEYMSFELPLSTIAGRAFKTSKIVIENNLLLSNEYRDKGLVEKYKLEEIVAIPLTMVQDSNQLPETLGVVCLYPDLSKNNEFFNNLDTLRESFSLAYTHSVERTKIQVREKVVSSIADSNDLNSALYKILNRSLREQISIEAASVYLYDERTRLLRLHATTGIKTEKDIHKHDIVFSKNDQHCITWKTFNTPEVISVSDNDVTLLNDKYFETTRSKRKSLLALPITKTPSDKSKKKTKGVLRIANKLLKHGHTHELISFTREDVQILGYICEIIGLTAHMFLNRDGRISYFEKIMHGTKSNIQTSIQNLDLLERHGKVESFLRRDLLFTVYDTREWLDDIKNQMDRLESQQSIEMETEPVNLAGTVLINAARLFEKSAQTRGIRLAKITNLRNDGFFDLPQVSANAKALLTVFRNLVENALKYRDHNVNKCIVKLSHREDNKYLFIDFVDYGIGIPLSEKSDIFDEGFRCENAVRQDPAGTGLGLTQSLEIMRNMGGDLILTSCKPVTLTVKLKKAVL